MATIFLDPRIKHIKILEEAIAIINKHKSSKVVCFLNMHQVEFLQEHQIDAVCYSFDEWPLQDRNQVLEKMAQGFYDQRFKPYTTLDYSMGGKCYRLNILRFLGPHFFLRNLFFPVAKTMDRYMRQHSIEEALVIGGKTFFHHVNFCLCKHNLRSNYHELEPTVPEKQFTIYTLNAIFRLCGTFMSRIFLRKKVIILPAGGITDELVSKLHKNRSIKIVNSIQRLIPIFQLFDFGFSTNYFNQRKDQISTILEFEKEASGKDEGTRLAYEIYADYIKNHTFIDDLKYCLATIRILNLIKPKLILQFNFNGDTYPFKIWSDQHGVPSLSVQHGFQGRFLMNIRYEIESDYYYAWADLPYDLERNPTAVFKPVGNPVFKSLPAEVEKITTLSIKNILLAPGALHYSKADADKQFWDDLLAFFEEDMLRHVEITVKLHRKDRYRDLTLRKLRQHPVSFIITEEPIRKSLLTCDLVITTVSTVALDAFGFDKLVILVNNAQEDEYYSQYDACIVVQTIDQLADQVKQLQTHAAYAQTCLEKQRKFYKRFTGDEAAETIANDILALIDS